MYLYAHFVIEPQMHVIHLLVSTKVSVYLSGTPTNVCVALVSLGQIVKVSIDIICLGRVKVTSMQNCSLLYMCRILCSHILHSMMFCISLGRRNYSNIVLCAIFAFFENIKWFIIQHIFMKSSYSNNVCEI